MKIAGIDFSINHPAICIIDLETNAFEFLVFPKERSKGHGLLEGTEVRIIDVDRLDVINGTNTTDRERLTTNNAMILASAVIDALPDDLGAIGIENLAFSATSNRLAEISGYQYILRYMLTQKYGVNNLYFFAASTVKAKAGNGRFDKNQMIEKFLESDVTGHALEIHKRIREHAGIFKKTKNWIKPIDDISDSYWIARCLMSSLS